jgi:ABC-type branched-subunit amino acid transport system permease subunit
MVLGIVLVVLVLALPAGIVGTLRRFGLRPVKVS